MSYIPHDIGYIPQTFTSLTQNSESFNIVKGNLNKLRLRSQILNEHCESSSEVMGTVNAATVVGQIFKASSPNINGIALTLQSAAGNVSFDTLTVNRGTSEQKAGTMEYSSDAEVQEEWKESLTNKAVRSAFTDVGAQTQDGSWAVKLPMDELNNDWRVLLTSTDHTGHTFTLRYASTTPFITGQLYFFISDGVNSKSFPLTNSAINLWQTFSISETSMTVTANDDTAVTPTMTAITIMGFRVDKKKAGAFGYVDSITYQVEPGSVQLELWDMGNSLPANNGSVNFSTAGTQYAELGDRGIAGFVAASVNLPLLGGKHNYHIDEFIAGTALENPSNTILTVGNYYAIVLRYVDTNVSVYGPDTTYSTNYYTNGYAWKAEVADNLIDLLPGAAGAGAYSDLMFKVYSAQDVYVTRITILSDSAHGADSSFAVLIEDENMSIIHDLVTSKQGGFGRTEVDLDFNARPAYLPIGGKIETYYNDDSGDSISKIMFIIHYLYVPPTVNG